MTGTGAYAEFIMEETQVVEDTVGMYTRIMFSVPETHKHRVTPRLKEKPKGHLTPAGSSRLSTVLVPSSLTQ